MLISILFIIGAFALLIKGADWLVTGASSLARYMNVSELAIGLTVVAFGTSMPELVVNIMASMNGFNDVTIGNVIGSNNFNTLMILGVSGIIAPLVVKKTTVKIEIPIAFGLGILFLFFANNFSFPFHGGEFSRFDSITFLVLFIAFIIYSFKFLPADSDKEDTGKKLSKLTSTLYILLGLAGLIIGGKLAVDHAVKIAEILGVSQRIIGLTIIAAGTSLPELATSAVAAWKKNTDIAVGNVVGSNIFNLAFILGLSAIIKPVSYNPSFNNDVYLYLIGSTILLISMFTLTKRKLDRPEAGILLILYIVYTVWLVMKG